MAENYNDLPLNLVSNFDVEFQEFLMYIFKKDKKRQNVMEKRKQFMEALRVISKSEGPTGSKLSFGEPLHRIGYLFRYSPCYTSAVANHFLGLVRKNSTILEAAMRQKWINICCLGGGPGTEVVAINKILSSALYRVWQDSEKPVCLRVTIVDENIEWKETACEVLQTLTNSAEIFTQAKIVIRLRYLEADLTDSLTENVQHALKEADIITIVALLSTLGKHFSKDVPVPILDIAQCMKPESVLFYLDIGKTPQCHTLCKTLRNLEDLKCVYGPNELEPYTLTLDSVKKNVELFWEKFYGNTCLSSAIVNSSAWIKIERSKKQTPLDSSGKAKANSKNAKSWKLQWEKKAKETDEVLKYFNRRVSQIVPSNKQQLEKKSPTPDKDKSLSVKQSPFNKKSADKKSSSEEKKPNVKKENNTKEDNKNKKK